MEKAGENGSRGEGEEERREEGYGEKRVGEVRTRQR